MNLIDLKQAPIVDKAQEGATLFALNTDGTVERISAENVGGGKIVETEITPTANIYLMSLDGVEPLTARAMRETRDVSMGAYCEDMTFEEAREHLLNGERVTAVVHTDIGDGVVGCGCALDMTYYPADADQDLNEEIYMMAGCYATVVLIIWTADGLTVESY